MNIFEDPFRSKFLDHGPPDLDAMAGELPHPLGDPALDPDAVARECDRIGRCVNVDLGHPLLNRSVLVGLASIDLTFEGRHPMYGRGKYGYPRHDGFPPTIIAAVDALLSWDMVSRACQVFFYWLDRFVNKKGGEILYYGPALSEYGQLLALAARLADRRPLDAWPEGPRRALSEMLRRVLDLASRAQGGLIAGIPEADERDHPASYFHNNAWLARGLNDWAGLLGSMPWNDVPAHPVIETAAMRLRQATLLAIDHAWPEDATDWWLPPTIEPVPRPANLTATRLASYTNYRYWPELLSSGILPTDLANRIVAARRAGGGQFMGVTRFLDRLDDWPLYDYLQGLWQLGHINDFLYTLYGHVIYHQAEHHLTAYEQVSLPPGRKVADYCLPCQLVTARAAALLRPRTEGVE